MHSPLLGLAGVAQAAPRAEEALGTRVAKAHGTQLPGWTEYWLRSALRTQVPCRANACARVARHARRLAKEASAARRGCCGVHVGPEAGRRGHGRLAALAVVTARAAQTGQVRHRCRPVGAGWAGATAARQQPSAQGAKASSRGTHERTRAAACRRPDHRASTDWQGRCPRRSRAPTAAGTAGSRCRTSSRSAVRRCSCGSRVVDGRGR